jgi:hypothetical protein
MEPDRGGLLPSIAPECSSLVIGAMPFVIAANPAAQPESDLMAPGAAVA